VNALRRVVLVVALVGLGLQVAAGLGLHDRGPVVSALTDGPAQDRLPPYVLLVGLLLLTVAGDLVCVPVRRGEQTEELTLYEAAVVVAVLLLPARDALWVPVAAIAVASVLQRRDPLKSVFNLGNQGAATALLVVVVHTLAGPDAGLGWRTVVALVVGLLAFCAANLVGLTQVLRVIGEGDARHVLIDGARLALVTAAATVAMAGGGVLAATHAPALLAFSLVPALALLFAFRATAQAAEQRQRSARLLALSHVLAGRVDPDETLPAFLSQCRQALGADVALALLDGTGTACVDDGRTGAGSRPSTEPERAVLGRAGQEARVLNGALPEGWTSALLAPLEADGQRLGVLVLASRERSRPLGAGELTLLTTLASALAVALRGAAHLRRLVEATDKLQAVVDQSSDGILVLDGSGLVQLWSPAMSALTGRDETVALGRPLSSLLADVDLLGGAVLSPGEPQVTVEVTVERHDGEQRVVRCAHAGAFENGTLASDVVIVHDVTKERQVERLKADFIATVSHELRTPITPIKGYADLLRRKGDSLPPDKRAEYLEVIGDRCDHLARLVEDLLLASRISATEGTARARVAMSSSDLSALVGRVVGDVGDEAARVALDVPEQPVPVLCDPARTGQVLTIMIGNALKYSAAGTPVAVTVLTDGRVEVHDVGRGIPADQLERVFDKFHRVEDPMRMTTGGTGLGLYIARQLTGAMGGSLTCTSTLGVGSVFALTLPLLSSVPVTTDPTVSTSSVLRVGPVRSLPDDAARGGAARSAHAAPR